MNALGSVRHIIISTGMLWCVISQKCYIKDDNCPILPSVPRKNQTIWMQKAIKLSFFWCKVRMSLKHRSWIYRIHIKFYETPQMKDLKKSSFMYQSYNWLKIKAGSSGYIYWIKCSLQINHSQSISIQSNLNERKSLNYHLIR